LHFLQKELAKFKIEYPELYLSTEKAALVTKDKNQSAKKMGGKVIKWLHLSWKK